MFDLLGTPDDDKVQVVCETDHYLPRNEMTKKCLDFLDRYLGP
jgi:hypothetical protein